MSHGPREVSGTHFILTQLHQQADLIEWKHYILSPLMTDPVSGGCPLCWPQGCCQNRRSVDFKGWDDQISRRSFRKSQLGSFGYLTRLSPGQVRYIDIGRDRRADQKHTWGIKHPNGPGNSASSPKEIWMMCLGTRTTRLICLACCHHDLAKTQIWKSFAA